MMQPNGAKWSQMEPNGELNDFSILMINANENQVAINDVQVELMIIYLMMLIN